MKKNIPVFFTVFFMLVANICFAPPHPPGGGSNPQCWPYCVPIDGGLVFLIAAAVLYGVVKLHNYKRKVRAKV